MPHVPPRFSFHTICLPPLTPLLPPPHIHAHCALRLFVLCLMRTCVRPSTIPRLTSFRLFLLIPPPPPRLPNPAPLHTHNLKLFRP